MGAGVLGLLLSKHGSWECLCKRQAGCGAVSVGQDTAGATNQAALRSMLVKTRGLLSEREGEGTQAPHRTFWVRSKISSD